MNRLDNISWLEDWYETQCDGDWEHQHGLKIDTLDNPGWQVQIDLDGTRFSEGSECRPRR
jgi:Immunity protein 53